MSILGLNGKAYRNTGTFSTPVWDEVPNVTDVELDMAAAAADVTSRAGSGWRQRVASLLEGTVKTSMIYETTDADFTAFQTAFFAKTQIDCAFMDGSITTAGNQGLRASFAVGKMPRKEELEDAMRCELELWVSNGQAPAWYTVPGP